MHACSFMHIEWGTNMRSMTFAVDTYVYTHVY